MEIKTVNYPVGAHVRFRGQISESVLYAIEYGMNAMQIFLGSQQSFSRTQVGEEDIQLTLDLLRKYQIHIFTHFPVIANLAGSIKSLAWNGDTEQDRKTCALINSIEYELGVMAKVGKGVVIHPGSYKDKKKAIHTIGKTLNRINYPKNSRLILENCAGEGTKVPGTLQEIREILDCVEDAKKSHIGICIDTCHTYGYGDYDLGTTTGMSDLFTDFDTIVGREYLALVHLNDSKCPLKSRKDRHACLGQGEIWGNGTESLKLLLKTCKSRDIPMILETHVTDMIMLSEID